MENSAAPAAIVRRGDSMDHLRRIKDDTAAAVITDPPFGIGYEDRNGRSILNDDRPFIWWMREAFRIVRDRGCMLCFCRWDVQDIFKMAVSASGFRLRSQVIWDKVAYGQGDLTATFSPQHEVIWFATKGRFRFPDGRPSSVIRVPRPHYKHRSHPTEKPVELMRQLVRAVTSPGDLVVDPFAGSGVTGEACIMEGRRAHLIELDPEHARNAARRVRSAIASLN